MLNYNLGTDMKKNIYTAVIIGLSFFITYCSDVPNWGEETYNPNPPEAVTNPIVENINGGAIIRYSLIGNKDLLGVKALYSYNEGGEIFEAYSSAYTDSIVLVGFPDTIERSVTLMAISKSNVESKPIEVKIQPLIPPVEVIRNSLKVRETFSGVFVSWQNPTRTDIGITLYAEDSLGTMVLDNTYFTKTSGQYSFRGYESKETKYRIEIKDRWNNMAAPLDTVLTPIYEEDVVARDAQGRATWIRYGYYGNQNASNTTYWRGDYNSIYGSGDLWKMFDPVTTASSYFHPGLWSTFYVNVYSGDPAHAGIEPKPMHFTIDMTRETKLSRATIFFRNDGNRFNPNDPYHVSVYATNETPKGPEDFNNDKMASLAYWTTWPQVNGTGEWMNDWTHIGEFYFTPPSGARTAPEWTADDKAWSRAGIEKEFFEEYSNTPFRYLRIVCHESIEGSQLLHFVRWDIFGSVVR